MDKQSNKDSDMPNIRHIDTSIKPEEPKTETLADREAPLSNKGTSFNSIVIKYYLKWWKLGFAVIGTTVISVCCTILLPLLLSQITTKIMYDSATTMQHLQGAAVTQDLLDKIAGLKKQSWNVNIEFWWYIVIGGISLAINMVMMYLGQFFGVILGKKIEIELRDEALAQLVKQDISYYSDKKIGDTLTKIISDTQITGDQAYQIPAQLIRLSLTVIGGIIMMFFLDGKNGFQYAKVPGVVCACVIVVMAAVGLTFTIVKKKQTTVRSVITDINGFVTDRINNVRLIKSSGTENKEIEGFEKAHEKYLKANINFGKVVSWIVVAIFGGTSLIQLVMVGAGAGWYNAAINPAWTPKEITDHLNNVSNFWSTFFPSLSLAQGLLIGSIMQLMMVSVNLANATVSSKRVFSIINSRSIMDPHYDGNGIKIDGIYGDIVFKDVSFAYPEKPEKVILPKFSFTFEQGKSYAFVGETGAGKSTIARMLLREYDPTTGEILINNDINLKDVVLSTYLAHVGYVEQEPQILFGDVYDNVKYGTEGATNEEVIEACKKADLDSLVQTWPDKYDTILGEHGFMLSGGQKQRIVIARMFLKNPQLLILDEATSALDNIVEAQIQKQLDKLMEGRTTVSIAHRLSTIKNVDEIIVLGANGKGIVQRGTFKELTKKPGVFQNLWKAGQTANK